MTKLYAANLNIYNPIKSSLESAKNTAKSGQEATNSFPSSYECGGYIKSLSSKFAQAQTNILNIQNKVFDIDKRISELIDGELTQIRLLDDASISENNQINL